MKNTNIIPSSEVRKDIEPKKEIIYYCEQGNSYCQSPNCRCNTVRSKEEPKQTDEKGRPVTYWKGLEKSKQERVCNCGLKESEHNVRHPFIARQETLEEALINFALKHFRLPKELFLKMSKCSQNNYLLEEEFGLDNTTKYREILGFINGAKWQAERMHSEEEVFKLLNTFNTHTLTLQLFKLGNSLDVKDWFEEYKKK